MKDEVSPLGGAKPPEGGTTNRALDNLFVELYRAFFMNKTEKPFVIPIFLPNMGCPHRCVFCNQTPVTGETRHIPSPEELCSRINTFLYYKGKERKPVQIAFYGGNFLGLREDDIISLLYESAQFVRRGMADSIRFSTRPDTIDPHRLDLIKSFPVSTVELGVQSMDDRVLSMANRGHTALDTERAAGLLKERHYEVGMQMMVGLPGDDETGAVDSAEKIAGLSPDFVRIYPTVVLADSLLAKWHKAGTYVPLEMDECVTLVKNLCLFFREKRIPVIRMGLQASEELEKGGDNILAGPYHPAFGHLVYSEMFLDKATSMMEATKIGHDSLLIRVHPRNISEMRGIRNRNVELIKKRFHIRSVNVLPDPSLEQGEVKIGN